jgi:hypothetical protein
VIDMILSYRTAQLRVKWVTGAGATRDARGAGRSVLCLWRVGVSRSAHGHARREIPWYECNSLSTVHKANLL